MWSEEGQLEEEPLTLISLGNGEPRQQRHLRRGLDEQCDVQMVSGQTITDYPIATESGDVYFYSPEVLDQDEKAWKEPGTSTCIGWPYQLATTLSVDGNGALIRRIQVSPDGSHAAFVTKAKLTAYDNEGRRDVLVRSVDRLDRTACPAYRAASRPPQPWRRGLRIVHVGRRQDVVLDKDALVAKDTDEGSDVYEYVEGRPQLISSGTGQAYHEAAGEYSRSLMGISPNGVDVYFSTFETLSRRTGTGLLKFYDARTGAGFEFTPEHHHVKPQMSATAPSSSPPG